MVNLVTATVDDFILTFGELESLELSNLESVNETLINRDKIKNALDLAYGLILNYYTISTIAGKIAICRALKYFQLNIARYQLDSLKRREDVTKTYDSIISILDTIKEADNANISDQEILDCGLDPDEVRGGKKICFSSGRRAFTDESLKEYRDDRLYFSHRV